ncbi:glycosyltransferase family 2 protein [Stutzerimonas kunmingensis]|uniref:glycosyltransferase family 2 protein n=1 Tax=Stutzerimonas kunmingensis TaxID=1211807 RepID=UPI002896387C|nr:glycosyltransferase family 2 protein [Stutzerimonas kunmingensis]
MLNILIPMAGAGSRFSAAGYTQPKPLIPVRGAPMLKWVIDNIRPQCEHRYIFICQQSHIDDYDLRHKLEVWAPGCAIVSLPGLTEGAACTVYAAKHLIENNDPVMIANSDQYISHDINRYLAHMDSSGADGLIMTMEAHDPKWSFVELNDQGNVVRVVEKDVISPDATVGIYNFRSGRELLRAIEAMFESGFRVNGEFYLAPVYNEMIARGAKVVPYRIGGIDVEMFGLGTPEDLQSFLETYKG